MHLVVEITIMAMNLTTLCKVHTGNESVYSKNYCCFNAETNTSHLPTLVVNWERTVLFFPNPIMGNY